MTSPCENTDLLKAHTAGINQIAAKQDRIEESHRELVQEIRSMIQEMKAMFGADIELRKDVDQLRKESDLLFEKLREGRRECEARADRFQTTADALSLWKAGIEARIDPKKIDHMHEFILQEQGWRRFVPALMATIAFLISVASALTTIFGPQ